MANEMLFLVSIVLSLAAIWFAGGFGISVAEGLVLMIIGFGVFWIGFTLIGLVIPLPAAAILAVVLAIIAVRRLRGGVVEAVPGGAS